LLCIVYQPWQLHSALLQELLHGLLRPRPQDLEEADLLLAFAACAALQPGAGGAAEA
jgi:hypothetical protein